MESVAIKPKRAQIKFNVIALGILCGLSLTGSFVCVVCAMLLPLFACPLAKHPEEKLAWVSCALPAAAVMVHTADLTLAIALLCPGVFPLLATRLLHPKERTGLKGVVVYLSLITLCMTPVLGALSRHMTAPLPDLVIEWVAQSGSAAPLLLRLAQSGLISLPEGYQADGLLSLLTESVVMEQMLLSFRRTVELFVQTQLPALITQACMLIGLFTALRVEHLNGVMLVVEVDPRRPAERKTHVTSPPGFRLLVLPPKFRIVLMAVLLFSMVLSAHAGLGHTLSMMLSQFVLTCFQLVGASVMVFVFAKKHPDHLIPIGIAVGLVYALLPSVLLIIGLSDSFVHYRTHKVREDSET